jgi:hypothetical protein
VLADWVKLVVVLQGTVEVLIEVLLAALRDEVEIVMVLLADLSDEAETFEVLLADSVRLVVVQGMS